LGSMDHYAENLSQESPIHVHFLTGKKNGYFDVSKDQEEDWNKLVDNAVFPIINEIGSHRQIAYHVDSIKKYEYGRGIELISNYDSLVYRQHRIMGMENYNKVP